MSEQIQATFIRAAKKPNCEMVKVIIPGRKAEGEWADCPANVRTFAGKSFQEGEQVVLTAEFVNSKYNVTRIEKVGGAPVAQAAPATVAPGTAQAAPPATVAPQTAPAAVAPVVVQQTYTPPPAVVGQIAPPKQYMNPKTPEESAQIMKLSVYSSACEAVQALIGHVDPNNICDVIDVIYVRGLAKVGIK